MICLSDFQPGPHHPACEQVPEVGARADGSTEREGGGSQRGQGSGGCGLGDVEAAEQETAQKGVKAGPAGMGRGLRDEVGLGAGLVEWRRGCACLGPSPSL